MKSECDRATNTEYCIYAMKTLVYELSNCLASAWDGSRGGDGGITMSLLLSDDFIIIIFLVFRLRD